MKKFLLSLTLLGAFLISSFLSFAQPCGVGNPVISNVSTYTKTTNGKDSCYAKFDLTFALKANNGNKLVGISLWTQSKYVSPQYSKVPSQQELSNSLGTILINNEATGTTPQNLPVFTSYPYVQGNTNTGVVMLRSDPIVTRTFKTYSAPATDSFYFTITNIIVAAPKIGSACPVDLLSIKGDLWSSNAGSDGPNTPVQCFSRGAISFSLGNPAITSAKRNCNLPRTLNFIIETISSTPITVTYRVYKDDGVINPSTGQVSFNPSLDTDVTLSNTNPITDLSSTYPYNATNIGFVDNDKNYSVDEFYKYWVVVSYTPLDGPSSGLTYSVTRLIQDQCEAPIILPVTYASFNATRSSNSQVLLEWETSMEENNRGFHVQKYVNGEWKNIAFVFTQADKGNSTSSLKYSFKDANSNKGITQYRILQVDMDGKGRYSEVRSIRGEEMATRLTIFPNPSSTGAFSLLFEDAGSVRDVMVSDVSGRAVKQFRGISSNSLSVEGLTSGFYTVQVRNLTTGVTATEKVIIKKR